LQLDTNIICSGTFFQSINLYINHDHYYNTFAKIRVQKKLGKTRQNYQSISVKSKRLVGISNPYTLGFTLKKVIWISRREFLGLTVFAKFQTKETGTGKPSRMLGVKGLSNHPRKLAKVLLLWKRL